MILTIAKSIMDESYLEAGAVKFCPASEAGKDSTELSSIYDDKHLHNL